MTPRETRQTLAKNGAQKKSVEERLLEATESLLQAGQNFASITVNQLTKEASMSRGTFYLHFKDKGELVSRLTDYLTQEVISSFGTWTENAELAEPKDMRAAVRGMVKSFKSHQAIIVAIRDTLPNDQQVQQQYESMMNLISGMAMKSILKINSRGLSRREANNDVGNTLGWMVGLYCTHFIDKLSPSEQERSTEALEYICESVIFSDETIDSRSN